MKKYIIIVLLFFSQLAMYGGDPFEMYFETKSSDDNSVEIDIKVKDFRDVYGFQMFFKWDSTVLRYDTITFVNSALEGFLANDDLGANILSAGWSNALDVTSLSDDDVIFTVKYKYSGSPCDETTLSLFDIDSYHRNLVTFRKNNVDSEGHIRGTDTTVKIPGDNCGEGGNTCKGFTLDVERKYAKQNKQVCVKIKVDSFIDIGALQFSVMWDTTIISWVKIRDNSNWAKLHGANVVTLPQKGVFKYLMDADPPLTMQKGASLIDLCYLVNPDANDGDKSPIKFVDSLEFEVNSVTDAFTNTCLKDGSVTVGEVLQTVTFKGSNEVADKSEKTCVNITAKQFTNIISFQMYVDWDDNVIDFTGIGDVNKIGISYDATNAGGNITKVGNNALNISWNEATGVTLPDDDTLFQLCYNTVGDCGDNSSVEIKDGPEVKIEVGSTVNGEDVSLNHIEVPGSVDIVCAVEIDTIVKKDVECNGDSNGSIFVKMKCQTCNYTFKWSDGATGPSRNALTAGVYTVTITDTDSNDTTEETVTISQPDPLLVSGTASPADCDKGGSVILDVSGETSPYTFVWSNGSTTKDITGVDPGSYSVKVTDAKGCGEVNKSFTVKSDIDKLVVAKGEVKNVDCFGGKDGGVSIAVSGGCVPYTILWSNGENDKTILTGLSAGDYSVTVTDSKGTEKAVSFTVGGPAADLDITGSVIDGANASVDITVTGGTEGYTYNWTGPAGFAGSTDEDLTGLTIGGTYTVEVTDANGCTKSKSFEVNVTIYPIYITDIAISDFNGFGVECNGDCTGTVDATIVANPPWQVYLNDEAITLPYSGLCAGTYTLKIVDKANYTTDTTFEITEPDELTVQKDHVDCTNSGKEEGSVSVIVDGGISPYSYYWGKGFDDSAEITDLPKGKYSVEVTDANGCKVLSEELKVDDCDRSDCYKGSSVISPNGDEFNEYFLIKCYEDFPKNELIIYDRLGNKVFGQTNYDGTWNGLDLNSKPLIEGSYMWVFLGYDENNNKSIYKGTVTILR